MVVENVKAAVAADLARVTPPSDSLLPGKGGSPGGSSAGTMNTRRKPCVFLTGATSKVRSAIMPYAKVVITDLVLSGGVLAFPRKKVLVFFAGSRADRQIGRESTEGTGTLQARDLIERRRARATS